MRMVTGSEGVAGGADAFQRLSLDRDEWDLVWAMRDVPPGGLKTAMVRLLQEIVAYVGHPCCAESQADGVPCSTVAKDCAQCQKVEECLGLLHEALHLR